MSKKLIKYNKMHTKFYGLLGILLYRIALDLVYVFQLSPLYSYMGLTCVLSVHYYLISWGFLLLFIFPILKRYKRDSISNSIIVAIALLSLVPNTSLMAFKPAETKYIVLYLVYWIMIFFYDSYLPKIQITPVKGSGGKYIIHIIAVILCIVVIYVSMRYTGLRFNFSLENVYELRLEARKFGLSFWLSYPLSAAGNVLPIILIYMLHNKQLLRSIAIIIVLFLDFSIAGHKIVLANLIICLLAYRFYRNNKTAWFSWGLLILTVLSSVVKIITGSYTLMSLTIRRVMYLPALLNYGYYSFFSSHGFDYFKQGVLRWFGASSSYDIKIARLIGQYYMGNVNNTANNGLFSDAYFNLGEIGVVFMPLLVIIVIKTMESVSSGLDNKYLLLPIVSTAMALISSPLSTILLTHGLLLIMFLLYCIPRTNKSVMTHEEKGYMFIKSVS